MSSVSECTLAYAGLCGSILKEKLFEIQTPLFLKLHHLRCLKSAIVSYQILHLLSLCWTRRKN